MQGSNKSHASHILAYNHKDIRLVKDARKKDFFAAQQCTKYSKKEIFSLGNLC